MASNGLIREIEARLKSGGWVRERNSGHTIWKHPATGNIFPVPSSVRDTSRRRQNLLHQIERAERTPQAAVILDAELVDVAAEEDAIIRGVVCVRNATPATYERAEMEAIHALPPHLQGRVQPVLTPLAQSLVQPPTLNPQPIPETDAMAPKPSTTEDAIKPHNIIPPVNGRSWYAWMRFVREANGLSRQDLTALIPSLAGCSSGVLVSIEAGKIKPSVRDLHGWCTVFGLDAAHLPIEIPTEIDAHALELRRKLRGVKRPRKVKAPEVVVPEPMRVVTPPLSDKIDAIALLPGTHVADREEAVSCVSNILRSKRITDQEVQELVDLVRSRYLNLLLEG